MRFPLVLGVVAAFFLAFTGGLFFGVERIPPAQFFKESVDELRDVAGNWRAYFATEPSQHLEQAVYEGDGVVASMPDAMQPGVTLLTGLFGERLGFRLMGRDGEVLWDWPVSFFDIAPDEMNHRFHALIHGTLLYPNGDIVANLDGRGLVRVDRCGNVLWRSKARSHHSISPDDNGDLWTPIYTDALESPHLSRLPFGMDSIGKFDPDTGELLEVVSLLDVLLKSDKLGLARLGLSTRSDVTHTNDVEVLTSRLADQFEGLNAGDMLVSHRNLHQIWIIDGETHELKWFFVGPIRGQHDPDFEPGGRISIFDNSGLFADPEGPASRVLQVDFATGEVETLFRGTRATPFFTQYRGKHQVLENGNVLIAETDRGRAFEVDPDGQIVWSYVNRFDDEQVGWLMQADRYPDSYRFDMSPCA